MVVDIERWIPERWDQVIGNKSLVDTLRDMVWGVRKRGHRSGYNTLVEGPSRCGKTSTIRLALKSLGCLNVDFETLNPCNKCTNCVERTHYHGTRGWEGYVDLLSPEEAPTPIRYFLLTIDCGRLTAAELEDGLAAIRDAYGYLRVIYLDECHRLARRSMDEQLLKPLEDTDAIWIASSACVKKEGVDDRMKLDTMFQNRFSFRVSTEKVSVDDLAFWLAERCLEWGIECEDSETTLKSLARRSGQSPGMALQVLNKAQKSRKCLLTKEMVDRHIFCFDE